MNRPDGWGAVASVAQLEEVWADLPHAVIAPSHAFYRWWLGDTDRNPGNFRYMHRPREDLHGFRGTVHVLRPGGWRPDSQTAVVLIWYARTDRVRTVRHDLPR